MRSGTENVPAIAAMALAFQMGHDDMDADREHVLSLKKNAFWRGCCDKWRAFQRVVRM